MMKCVECDASTSALIAKYGKDLNCLIPCKDCSSKRADKYIEYDNILIFIDLVLHRPSVYRHLLFNRSAINEASATSDSWMTLRIGAVLLLLDVYIKWVAEGRHDVAFLPYYLFLLSCAVLEFAASVMVIYAISLINRSTNESPTIDAITLAQVISNYPKALHILMVIWGFQEDLEYHVLIRLFMLSSNIEVMAVLFKASHSVAFIISGICLLLTMVMDKLLQRLGSVVF